MAFLVLLVIVGSLISRTKGAPVNNSIYYDTTCDSPECIQTANQLLSWLDPTVDPCQDFYRFTCGKGLSSGKKASDRDDTVINALKEILEEPPLDKELKCHQQLRRFYRLCMDEESIDGRGVVPAVDMLRQVGQWPLLNKSWSEVGWRWQDTEVRLLRWGLGGALFNIHVSENPFDHNKFNLFIDYPTSQENVPEMVSYMFSKSYKKPSTKNSTEIIDIIMSVAKQLGVDEVTMKKSMMEAVSFMILLKKTIDSGDESNGNEVINNGNATIVNFVDDSNNTDNEDEGMTFNSSNYEFTVAKLQKTFRWADWRVMLTAIVTLQHDDVIIVIPTEYLTRLGTFLNTVSNESLANYMMWNAAIKLSSYLSSDVSDLMDVKSGEDRWQHCVRQASTSGLSLALASLVAKKNNDITLVQRALRVAKDVQQQLVSDLANVSWVDEPTRKRAQTKISMTEFHIGYPKELLKDDQLQSHYAKFKMNTTNYFEAALDAKEWERRLSWRKIRLHAKKYYWIYDTESFFMKNAFNWMYRNTIEVTGPELIFQNTFNSKVPLYIAYGDLGTTIGHELIHSLDDNGINYNEEGDNEDWVEGENLENFEEKAQCIIDQYSAFNETTTNLKVNGRLTQGESISDNSGLKVAYHAYRRAANLLGPEPGLPHLQHYTPDQLFFIAAANYFCDITDKERLEKMIESDPHPPNEFRVKGMMTNSRYFSKAFNCDSDDIMNSPKKCEVW